MRPSRQASYIPGAVVKASLAEQVYKNLRIRLMNGDFRPGQRLTIAALSEQYGTSITPVREAISRLASEHALTIKAATSVIVPALTSRDLREIIAIRKELEGMAARRVGQIATSAMIEALVTENMSFVKAAATDPAMAAQKNRDFHFLILKFAEMPYIEAICENMWTLMGPFLRMFHEEIPVRRLTAENHLHFRFIEAIKAGDPDAACAAMQQDIAWSDELVTRHEELGKRRTA